MTRWLLICWLALACLAAHAQGQVHTVPTREGSSTVTTTVFWEAAKAPKAKKKQPDEAPTTPRRRRATKAAPAAQGAGLEDSPTVDAIVAALRQE